MSRKKMPNRHESITTEFEHGGICYILTVSLDEDGNVGEIFLTTDGKLGSAADTMAADASVLASLLLQHQYSIDKARFSLKRGPTGLPMGPIGKALDLAAKIMKEEAKDVREHTATESPVPMV